MKSILAAWSSRSSKFRLLLVALGLPLVLVVLTFVAGTIGVLTEDPAEAAFRQGRLLLEKKQYSHAVAQLNLAVDRRPKNATVRATRALAYRAWGLNGPAISDYTEVISLDRNYCEAYSGRAAAYESQGKLEEALTDRNDELNCMGESEPTRRARAYFHRGSVHRSLKRPREAANDFSEALRLGGFDRKETSALHKMRADEFKELHQWQRAIDDWTTVIQSNPEDKVLYLHRANAYVEAEKFKEAFEDFDRTLTLDPNDASYLTALIYRGILYRRLRQFDKALADHNRAIAIRPTEASAFRQRGLDYQERGEAKHALEDYDRAIALDPDFPQAYLLRAKLRATLGDYAGAIADTRWASEAESRQSLRQHMVRSGIVQK